MKKAFISVLLFLLAASCSTTFLKTGSISEQNRINMSSVQTGMTQDQVIDIMGYPYKTEEKFYDLATYEVWYYITEPSILGQTKLVTRNFTPLVFESGILKGWGRNFYKFTFNVDNEKWKRQIEKKQQYTNDKEEWPINQHAIIPPMNDQQKRGLEDKNKDAVNQTIPETEQNKDNQKEQPQIQINQTQYDQTQSQTQQKNNSGQQAKKAVKKPQPIDKKQLKKTKPKSDNGPSITPKGPCEQSDEKDIFIFWE